MQFTNFIEQQDYAYIVAHLPEAYKNLINELADTYVRTHGTGVVATQEHFTPLQMLSVVCRVFELSREELTEGVRKKYIMARFFYFYLCRSNAKGYSLQYVGSLVGKDHATVLYGIRQVENYLETKDPMFMEWWGIYLGMQGKEKNSIYRLK